MMNLLAASLIILIITNGDTCLELNRLGLSSNFCVGEGNEGLSEFDAG